MYQRRTDQSLSEIMSDSHKFVPVRRGLYGNAYVFTHERGLGNISVRRRIRHVVVAVHDQCRHHDRRVQRVAAEHETTQCDLDVFDRGIAEVFFRICRTNTKTFVKKFKIFCLRDF